MILKVLLISAVICQMSWSIKIVSDYDYKIKGPDTWWFNFPVQCDDLLFPTQSPVNLSENVLEVSKVPKLEFDNYDQLPLDLTLHNNGNGLKLKVNFQNFAHWPKVSKGPLNPNQEYHLHHIRFHWGGSEHFLEKFQEAAMEIQLMHYNMNAYKSYDEALQNTDGVVAVGYFILHSSLEISNKNWSSLISNLRKVQHAGSIANIEPFPINALVNTEFRTFRHYHGSLTTPPCSNTVTWILSAQQITISYNQAEEFLKLEDQFGKGISSNIRPLQKLNSRKILACIS